MKEITKVGKCGGNPLAPIFREKTIKCPKCKERIWDKAKDYRLNKCWRCGLAFD